MEIGYVGWSAQSEWSEEPEMCPNLVAVLLDYLHEDRRLNMFSLCGQLVCQLFWSQLATGCSTCTFGTLWRFHDMVMVSVPLFVNCVAFGPIVGCSLAQDTGPSPSLRSSVFPMSRRWGILGFCSRSGLAGRAVSASRDELRLSGEPARLPG